MRRFGGAGAFACQLPLLSAPHAQPMLFVYFKEPANMGVFFAAGNDGCHFQPLNGRRTGTETWWKLFDAAGRATAESNWKGKNLIEANVAGSLR